MTPTFDRPYTDPAIRREASHIARRQRAAIKACFMRQGVTLPDALWVSAAPLQPVPACRVDWYVDTHGDAGRTVQ
jgi:hypothetical protein